jgi:hypothetical protein
MDLVIVHRMQLTLTKCVECSKVDGDFEYSIQGIFYFLCQNSARSKRGEITNYVAIRHNL